MCRCKKSQNHPNFQPQAVGKHSYCDSCNLNEFPLGSELLGPSTREFIARHDGPGDWLCKVM